MKLAVVLPSRGLVYSKTVDELYRNLNALDCEYEVFWSHGRPIPDCFNVPTEQALAGAFDYVLFVEEDMVIPDGIVGRMLKEVGHALACEYPVSGSNGGTVMYDPDGRAFFTGCGLLLVETKLLRRMPKPIWRSDVRWKPWAQDGLIHFDLSIKSERDVYGQQDVAFGLRLYANGLPIEVHDETIGQRELVRHGPRGNNDGWHEIVDRMEVVPRDELKELRKRGLPEYREVMIDGKRVRVREALFNKMKDPVLPDYLRWGAGVFENSEVLDDWLRLEPDRA